MSDESGSLQGQEDDPMTYRPICDVWQLARPKLGGKSYYGAYPSGFLERACYLLGVNPWSRVLHVCGGALRDYHSGPTKGLGLGTYHKTIDLNEETDPDFRFDVRRLGVRPGDFFPSFDGERCEVCEPDDDAPLALEHLWDAALIDRPYSEADHEHYINDDVRAEDFPESLNDLLKRALSVVKPGGRVGVLDYLWPAPPAKQKWLPRPGTAWDPNGDEADKPATRLIATVQVLMGWNNRARIYSVYERLPLRREECEMEELAVAAIADQHDLVELRSKVSRLEEELKEKKTEIEALYDEEEVEEAKEEASLEHADPLIEWALDAGADPWDAPVAVRDRVLDRITRKSGYVWPGSRDGRLTQPDKQAVVKAAGRILESSGLAPADAQAEYDEAKGAGHASLQDPATGVPFAPAGRAERNEPAPTPTEAEEGYREVFQALTNPTEAPASPPADPALDGFV